MEDEEDIPGYRIRLSVTKQRVKSVVDGYMVIKYKEN